MGGTVARAAWGVNVGGCVKINCIWKLILSTMQLIRNTWGAQRFPPLWIAAGRRWWVVHIYEKHVSSSSLQFIQWRWRRPDAEEQAPSPSTCWCLTSPNSHSGANLNVLQMLGFVKKKVICSHIASGRLVLLGGLCNDGAPALRLPLCPAGQPVGGIPGVRGQTAGDAAALRWHPPGHEGKGDPGLRHGQVVRPGPGCQRGGGQEGFSGWCVRSVSVVPGINNKSNPRQPPPLHPLYHLPPPPSCSCASPLPPPPSSSS